MELLCYRSVSEWDPSHTNIQEGPCSAAPGESKVRAYKTKVKPVHADA